ncbi:peroxiredoxin [Catalinimonas alkaloidigena]|uniref:Peroxiredoxin n=1 Tax=Catalinimonas alkaloidigena TaxID=1075417 RepID=A0A1G9GHP0_9BACT|nr:alpha/beta hydrolase [Catalinimonas alkaloidigena]SDL00194.1 peroxiredoxin [Catalinimonas alkaloidigena]
MNFFEKTSPQGETINIAYEDYGQGQPVVLIHGWPLSQRMWEYQRFPLVEAGYRVISYDRRGFGDSSKPWNGYDYDSLTSDLKDLLDHLDLQNVVLVGFSMGGGEVARYFKNYGGERIAKAVLISAVTPFMARTDDNPNGVKQEVFDEIMQGLKEDRLGFLEDFGKQFFGVNMLSKPISQASMNFYLTLEGLASPRATRKCAKAFAQTDFRHDVQQINVPTLIVHGSSDKTVPIETSGDQAAKLIPDNHYRVFEGAPHGLFFTHKTELNNALMEFLGHPVASTSASRVDEPSSAIQI